MNEIFFEEYQFSAVMRTNPAFLSAYKYQTESAQRLSRYCLVVDSGYSFTHIVPMCDGRVMSEFVIRLTVGGKILTNRLVEIVSYRHLDVRSEVYIMNQCKEDVCYVSTDFWKDLECARRLDLRSVAPDDLPVNIFKPNNPQVYAWEGGALLANETEDLKRFLVTRAEYEECGSAQSERRFPVS